MDMTDEENENFLWQPAVTTTSTPAASVRPPLCRVNETVGDCFPTPPSDLQDVEGSSITEKERRAVEMLKELQRRHQELEAALVEERGRRKAFQEMMEQSTILQQGLAPSGQGRIESQTESTVRYQTTLRSQPTSGACRDRWTTLADRRRADVGA